MRQDGKGPSDSFERGEDAFGVTDPSEMVTLLKEIQAEKKLVILLSSGLKLAATILDIDSSSGQLVFDAGRDEQEIEAILAAEKLPFLAYIRGVSLRFSVPKPVETAFVGGPAFCSPLPVEMLYLQRRRFYRASIRLNRAFPCLVCLPDRTQLFLNIQDISVGGVRLQSNTVAPQQLPVGTVLPGAVLDFLEMGKLEMTLRVVSHAKTVNDGIANHVYASSSACHVARTPPFKNWSSLWSALAIRSPAACRASPKDAGPR
jgi:c-di-GMP-binding flagellar brake protein YcgR